MRAERSCAPRTRLSASVRARTDRGRGLAPGLLPLATLSIAFAAPARAEVAISGAIATDDRFRGVSTSGQKPVATFSIAYDDIHGPYAGLSFTAVATGDPGIKPLRSIQYFGYTKRLKSGLSLDIGISHRISSHYYTGEYGRRFTEAYVGIVGRSMSTHLFLSPNYDGHGSASLYVEVDEQLLQRGLWSLTGHFGALVRPKEAPSRSRTVEGDWRLGVNRRFGRTALSLSWVGATPAQDSDRWRGTVLLSVGHSF
jgi:uncharacterized protein (TIGR02001 family)